MDGEFDILLGGQPIGRASVKRQGLYYYFYCRCNLSGEVMHRLTVRCNERTVHLGIPVPKNGQFELQTRVAMKKLGIGVMEFRAVPKHAQLQEQFVPLSPVEPFRYIRRLQDAVLQVRDGKVGVVIPDSQ